MSNVFQVTVNPIQHLTYGTGPRGSKRLREALASFFNSNFEAREKVEYSDIVILSGVGSTVDSIIWAICNEGDGVIIPQPLYAGFQLDVSGRSRAVLVPAPFQDVQGYQGLDDIFDPKMNRKAFEKAYEKAMSDGITPRAVILTKLVNFVLVESRPC
jgi:bifunctional pyridoxal-dependent enzyme with beta-cystathionase and maltose regulon repressor activities